MATLTFDTYDFIETLKDSGIEEVQAKAIVDGLKQIDLENIATKEDLLVLRKDLEVALANLKADLIKWFVPMLLGQGALIVTLVKLL